VLRPGKVAAGGVDAEKHQGKEKIFLRDEITSNGEKLSLSTGVPRMKIGRSCSVQGRRDQGKGKEIVKVKNSQSARSDPIQKRKELKGAPNEVPRGQGQKKRSAHMRNIRRRTKSDMFPNLRAVTNQHTDRKLSVLEPLTDIVAWRPTF